MAPEKTDVFWLIKENLKAIVYFFILFLTAYIAGVIMHWSKPYFVDMSYAFEWFEYLKKFWVACDIAFFAIFISRQTWKAIKESW